MVSWCLVAALSWALVAAASQAPAPAGGAGAGGDDPGTFYKAGSEVTLLTQPGYLKALAGRPSDSAFLVEFFAPLVRPLPAVPRALRHRGARPAPPARPPHHRRRGLRDAGRAL